jgi:hypothetical protein
MDDQSKQRTSAVRAAIYARVSCEQQAQQSTIDSQIVALKDRVQADGLSNCVLPMTAIAAARWSGLPWNGCAIRPGREDLRGCMSTRRTA